MAQGINPSLADFQNPLHNVDTSQVTPIRVDFTIASLYCPVQNTFNTVVYLHNIKPNKGGAFFYYVQYLDCMEMCYFVNCQKVPDGELVVLFSMDLSFSVSILYYLRTYNRETSKYCCYRCI